MRGIGRGTRFLIGLWVVGLLARPARAEDARTELARIHLRAGIAYYDAGRYDDAAREMERAYQERPIPDLQYNLAQCYERSGRLEDAAHAYEEYLRGKPDSTDRSSVAQRIVNLRERVRAGQSGQPAAMPSGEKVVFKTIVVYKEAPPRPGRFARYTAYGVGVLALGALASGIATSVLAKEDADTVTRSGGAIAAGKPAVPFDSGLRTTQAHGETLEIIAGVSYGVAGLGALGAVGLYLLGNKIDREAPKLTFAPSLSPSGGGLIVGGGF